MQPHPNNDEQKQSSLSSHHPIIPVSLIITSVALIWGTAYTASDLPGHLQWILYGAGIPSLASLFWFRRQKSPEHQTVAAERETLRIEEKRFEETRKAAEEKLEKRLILIREREKEFFQKLTTYHEWMEFPKTLDKDKYSDSASDILPESEFEITERRRQDQAVLKLLEKKSEYLFDKIKKNEYYQSGEFQKDALTGDMLTLITDAAKIYNPDSENPLLETSVEKLLRSINRISLQLLVILEQIPFNLKDYNLKKAYDTFQTGIRAYDVYKSADTYISCIRDVYYLGRFALGANPVSLGIGWAVSGLLKEGAKRVSYHVTNQYALQLLQDMVFIVGNESAGIFGGDYRHRDPHWIYGAELTDLLTRFPISRNILLQALNEIGILRLRSEYDRIFLYRCAAANKSAQPDQFDAKTYLSIAERQFIAEQLESFFKHYLHQDNLTDIHDWKSAIEERLGVKFRLNPEIMADAEHIPAETKAAAVLFSLASFLMDIKKQPPSRSDDILVLTRTAAAMDKSQKDDVLRHISDAPPMIFDYPALESDDPLLEDYFKDLIMLAVEIFPHNEDSDTAIREAAYYFQWHDLKSLQKNMDRHYADFITRSFLPESPEKKLSPHMIRSLLTHLESGESLLFVYTHIIVEAEKMNRPFVFADKTLWLMGTSEGRLLLLAVKSEKKSSALDASLLWSFRESDGETLSAECVKNRLKDDCRLTGGTWHWDMVRDVIPAPTLRLSGHPIRRYESYFKLLIAFCENSGGIF